MYEPLSREFLLNRGYCCHNECINCPYYITLNEDDLVPIKKEFDQSSKYITKASLLVDSHFEYKRMCVQINNVTSVRVYINLRNILNNIKSNFGDEI